eukprot:NODE_80_length_22759_cov_1.466858.p5 type:complete len:447 gc:universal NODE_80_length_22759_cov_1.466858:7888-9228(+)
MTSLMFLLTVFAGSSHRSDGNSFMNHVVEPAFNTMVSKFDPEIFYPKVDPTLKQVDSDLLLRLQRYYTYVAIAHCKYGFENWKCGRCENTPVTEGTEFIGRFIGPEYSHYGYVAVNARHKEIYVNFNGATTPTHWQLMEFELNKIVIPLDPQIKKQYGVKGDIKVHRGLWKLFEDIYPKVLQQLREARQAYPDFQVVATGHSMGGVFVGYLAFQMLLDKTLNLGNIIITSFGSPRIGNIHFAKLIPKITKEAYRVTHNSDTIVKIPPKILGYVHYPVEIWLADKYIGDGDPIQPEAFKSSLSDSEFDFLEPHTYICDDYRDDFFRGFEDERCLLSTKLHFQFKMSYKNMDPAQVLPSVPDDKASRSLVGTDPETLGIEEKTGAIAMKKKEKLFSSWISENYPITTNSFPNYYMHSTFWKMYSTSDPAHGLCLAHPTESDLRNKSIN